MDRLADEACILGIDPGSRVTGFGVIRAAGPREAYLASGCIRTGDDPLPRRLERIFTGLEAVIAEHAPGELAIEQVFLHRNADSALKLGHARGVAMMAAVRAGLAVHEYSATAVKQAVVGRGHAEKGQVQHMVGRLLGLAGALQEDAADALAVALCHAHHRRTLGRMPAAAARGGWRRR